MRQNKAPIYEALMEYKKKRVVSFDVPGHKQGKANPELIELFGEKAVSIDVNSMKPLDNLCHPVGVIRDAEILAAEAFGAENVFFMINGTSSAVQAMIMYSLKRGEKIIMPRNVHRSAINALVVTGAVPIYVDPGVNNQFGIPLGMSVLEVEKAVRQNPDAKAILINNPTYYGICSDLKKIVDIAHKAGMLALVDEAHGTHFYFGDNMPVSAMAAGADISAASMHKTGGSLTQSSFLVMNKSINAGYMRQVVNLAQTTSASYLLLSSLDLARKNLVLNGKEIFKKVIDYAEYARSEINSEGGFYAFSKEMINGDDIFDFDVTKLSVHTRNIGLAGIEVYDILRDDYGIQIEFGDIGNILAIISVGDRMFEIERLISSLSEIKRLYSKPSAGLFTHEYINPEIVLTPQEAFYSPKRQVPIEKSEGEICSEFVMCYPPGIPILAPGEKITGEIIRYINYAKEKGCFMTGTEDMKIENINIVS